MSLWRREAIERFPELHREIADAEGIYFAWMALWHSLFMPAYERHPPDTRTAGRVYGYAAWCLKQRSLCVRRAVADEFYERLPSDPLTHREMPHWISQQEFDTLASLLTLGWDATVRQDFNNVKRSMSASGGRPRE